MNRILMVGPVPPPEGGIASVMASLLESDLANHFQFDVFDKSEPVIKPGRNSPKRIFTILKCWALFWRKLQRGSYALVHMHGSVLAFPGVVPYMVISRMAGAKLLLHMHGTSWERFYSRASTTRRVLAKFGLSFPHFIIVLYREWVNNIKQICPRAKVDVVVNFVGPIEKPASESIDRTRAELGLTREDFVVLTVGTLGLRKGSYEILKAVRKVSSQCDSVRFVLVGGYEFPKSSAELEKIVEVEQIHRWIRIPGEMSRDKIPALMAGADVFLLPSYSEGMPVALIEAMRSGLPIITTPVGAIPDMLQEGISALFVRPGSPDEIAKAVLALESSPDLRRTLGENSAVEFKRRFEISKVLGEIAHIYQTILGSC